MDKETYFVGIDESNHGRYPEIFVGVFSNDLRDIKKSSFGKIRNKKEDLVEKLGNRDYYFSLLNKKDKYRIPDRDLGGLITSNLLFPFIRDHPNSKYELYWDGEIKLNDLIHTKEMTCNLCGIEEKNLLVRAGKSFDKKYYLVNLADSIAYQLFKRSSLRRKNKHKVPFLY